MKIIKKGNDLQYHITVKDNTGQEVSVTLKNYYKICLYTEDSRIFIDVTSFLNASNILSVDCQLFKPLASGQVHIKVMFSDLNPDFHDGKYDYMKIINTEYYYDSEGTDTLNGAAQWGLIYGSIGDQSDLLQFIRDNTSDKDIVGLTQAEYDYLVIQGQVKQNNLYVITDNN